LTKYCCDKFTKAIKNGYVDYLDGYYIELHPLEIGFNDYKIPAPKDSDGHIIDYCPFCGKRLK